MNALRVIEPGLSTTVQDLGRPGYMPSGVPIGGAADTLSLRIANRLLTQPDTTAALELTAIGGTYAVAQPTLVCLAGAAAPQATIQSPSASRPVSMWTPTQLDAGDRILIGPLVTGARAYLAIAGGIATTPVLGSRSTHAASHLGVPGRPLHADDELPLAAPNRVAPNPAPSPRLIAEINAYLTRRTLRLLPLAHHRHFSVIADDQLFRHAFTVSDRSGRTGMRLEGPNVPSPPSLEVAEPALPGVIQIPPAGRPIILGPDGPTTGGYPMPFAVIAADLPALAQWRPRDPIRFERTTVEHAHEEARRLESLIDAIAQP